MRYEEGLISPSFEDVDSIAEALGVSEESFFTTDEALSMATDNEALLERRLYSARKRLSAITGLAKVLLKTDSLEDIAWSVFKAAQELTESEYGFVGHIDRETKHMVSTTLSPGIFDKREMEKTPVVFPEYTGLWGWVLKNKKPLLTNDPANDPRSTGVPNGHASIHRFISVPAMMGDALVGQIAMGNAPRDYTRSDLTILRQLSDLYALALQRHFIDEDLIKARDAAETASSAKSVFLTNVTHEIRTPMNAILGMSELLLQTKLSPEQTEYQEAVYESARTLLSVMNDILDFAKIEAGKMALRSQSFNLVQTVSSRMPLMREIAAKNDNSLDFSLGDGLPDTVIGDPARLNQVVSNLLSNAMKFTRKGAVKLTIEKASPAQCQDVGDDDPRAHCLLFCVEDNGIGISEDKMELVYESFRQVDGSMSRPYGGAGLGLSISKRLVELMGGRIWVKSELGKGSTFWFSARFEESR